MLKCEECDNESEVLYHRSDKWLWVCPTCIMETIGIEPDPQRSRTTRAAVQPAIELLRRIRRDLKVKQIMPASLVDEIDAVLKTAGGG